MIEGAFIDSGGHINDSQTVIEESFDFDQAIAAALRFADRDGKTLVIITADHETGGVSIPQGNLDDRRVELEFSTEDHTAIMVPIFAYGPQSGIFRGVYENTAVFNKINQVLKPHLK
jgi:alkaline phosphatase